ncbi:MULTISPECIES: HD-GYP domain-containing protein [unclassified Fusibacter]|uniref:HD-GYP domain-containing protein n=1 Tax=unclassified Fusibacter TaxID=2624464 RepID=UPI0013E907E4|nr:MULTISPECIES: HD domain-containing phosphohydrolase [unclassified Fusibacter]MCK8059131.1 HD domain-containing protein [Fusibacter sp. A2]NPE22540.1 HD domain-containing protein [Fusibacter sp. A1]
MNNNMFLGAYFDITAFFDTFFCSLSGSEHIKDVNIAFFDSNFERISYQYGESKLMPDFIGDIKKVRDKAELVKTESFTDVFRMLDVNENREPLERVLLFVKNPLYKEALYICSIRIEYLSDQPVLEELNYNHFEQFCYNMQSVILNYDKLFLIVDSYSEMLSAKDHLMPYHLTNVANWCVRISEKIELSTIERNVLYISALLHDIGKLFVPDYVLNKVEPLTHDEYYRIKRHPIKSEELVKGSFYGMSLYKDIPLIVRSHHEHYDGKGYPDGLKEEEIPFLSRILTIGDGIDAMLSKRVYKEALEMHDVIKEIKKCSGTQYDPLLAEVAVEVLEEFSNSKKFLELSRTKFISNASICFYYENYYRLVSFKGNLILDEENGTLQIHDHDPIVGKLDISKMYRATISFFESMEFYELTTDIERFGDQKFYLTNLKNLPTDKYFSLNWSGKITMTDEQNKASIVDVIKLGGNSIVFEAERVRHSELDSLFNGCLNLKLSLDEKSDERDVKLKARVLKHYQLNNKEIFVAKFVDVCSSDRDLILRMLFRKQMENVNSMKRRT